MNIKFNAMAAALLLASISLTTPASAGQLKGTVVPDNDCDSNAQGYTWSDCEDLGAYRIQGVVYNDLNGQDITDAVGAVCRKYGTAKGSEIQIASDYWNAGNHRHQKKPLMFMCEPKEVLAGIACKDLSDDAKNKPGNDDALDGCTAVCQVPGHEKRLIPNADLESNPRPYVYHTVDLPNRVAGIGYKEEKKDTDRADCGNVSWVTQPIVKEGVAATGSGSGTPTATKKKKGY